MSESIFISDYYKDYELKIENTKKFHSYLSKAKSFNKNKIDLFINNEVGVNYNYYFPNRKYRQLITAILNNYGASDKDNLLFNYLIEKNCFDDAVLSCAMVYAVQNKTDAIVDKILDYIKTHNKNEILKENKALLNSLLDNDTIHYLDKLQPYISSGNILKDNVFFGNSYHTNTYFQSNDGKDEMVKFESNYVDSNFKHGFIDKIKNLPKIGYDLEAKDLIYTLDAIRFDKNNFKAMLDFYKEKKVNLNEFFTCYEIKKNQFSDDKKIKAREFNLLGYFLEKLSYDYNPRQAFYEKNHEIIKILIPYTNGNPWMADFNFEDVNESFYYFSEAKIMNKIDFMSHYCSGNEAINNTGSFITNVIEMMVKSSKSYDAFLNLDFEELSRRGINLNLIKENNPSWVKNSLFNALVYKKQYEKLFKLIDKDLIDVNIKEEYLIKDKDINNKFIYGIHTPLYILMEHFREETFLNSSVENLLNLVLKKTKDNNTGILFFKDNVSRIYEFRDSGLNIRNINDIDEFFSPISCLYTPRMRELYQKYNNQINIPKSFAYSLFKHISKNKDFNFDAHEFLSYVSENSKVLLSLEDKKIFINSFNNLLDNYQHQKFTGPLKKEVDKIVHEAENQIEINLEKIKIKESLNPINLKANLKKKRI